MRLNSSLAVAGFAAALLLSTAPVSAQPFIGGPWSGLYVGGNLGGAFDANKLGFSDLSAAQDLSFSSQNNDSKFLGGVHAGYDFQPGGIMFGVEGDSDFGDNINYLASIRGRLGVPIGPVLIYGTGGAAFEGAHEQFAVNSTAGGVSTFSRHVNKTGWTVGGGVETYIMPALSIGAEGLWYDLGRDTVDLTTPPGTGAEPFSVTDDRKFAVARARITYHLGW
jgi:outer membrane immunogenic protein